MSCHACCLAFWVFGRSAHAQSLFLLTPFLRARVAQLEGIVVDDQVLVLSNVPLDDELTLAAYGVGEHDTFQVTARLLGGKVHGSLARAGKVKGQTPKVAKMEKKKKKTGRAKRRLQYNRRFVNVVPTFGKKKGHQNSFY
uniref:FAU ubiquitin like and ribosomal protein S30 fusion n=1 Tax=Eptatretus burgeri TaxID=7764 RepID=A0A8C4Q4P0_EPTBU